MPPELTAPTPNGVSLAAFTSEALILPQLRGRDTSTAIHELSKTLEREVCVPGMLPVYQSALNREYLVSTATECGMAFPHARLSAVDRICFALGRATEPIAWGGARTVHIVFLLAVPATDASDYLSLLSRLTALAKDSDIRGRLMIAESAAAIYQILKSVQLVPGRTSAPAVRA